MATSAFRVYNSAKKKLLTGAIDLDTAIIKAALGGGVGASAGAQKASDYTLSVLGQVSALATGGGYGAKTLGGVSVTLAGSTVTFDATDLSWSAAASAIVSIKYLVLYTSGASAGNTYLIGWVHLTDTQFTLATGNKLTITWNASGIFTLTGGTT
jgi:hypothetical protein